MKNKNFIWIAIIGIGAAILYFARKAGGGIIPGTWTPKFSIGQNITYKDLNPLNVIYSIAAINLTAKTYDLYDLSQPTVLLTGFDGPALDANYVVV